MREREKRVREREKNRRGEAEEGKAVDSESTHIGSGGQGLHSQHRYNTAKQTDGSIEHSHSSQSVCFQQPVAAASSKDCCLAWSAGVAKAFGWSD